MESKIGIARAAADMIRDGQVVLMMEVPRI